MANICISSVCNLDCSYCFAADLMAAARPGAAFISLDDFDRRLDVLERSSIHEARLLGGEPTLHPDFSEIVGRAKDRIGRVVVFTNGQMPESALRALELLPADACTVIVNMTTGPNPSSGSAVNGRRRTVLRRLGPRALLGITVTTPRFDYDWVLQLVELAGCQDAIRIGLAHPCVDGGNDYLHQKQYPQVGRRVVRFAQQAAQFGIRLEFDCGFVRCMFSNEELATLSELDADVGWRCGPVCDIDVTDRAMHCFPLATRETVPVVAGVDVAEVRDRLASVFAAFRVAGVYRECSSCAFRAAGECSGGCLAATIRRFRQDEFRVVRPVRSSRPIEIRSRVTSRR